MSTDSAPSLQALLADYKAQDAAWEKQKEKLAQAAAKRSQAVKAIAAMIFPTKKIKFEGKEMTIVVRDDVYFFRTSKGEVIEVG